MEKYKHFISLGYFCSVALELERIGLRSCSSPFDWCISEWEGVERAITTHFENFLCYDNLYQNRIERAHYKDVTYDIAFFHDFNKYVPLEEQIDAVQAKYQRRIQRFYENISEPTLFIRYISNESGRKEIDYIEKNYTRIIRELKKFNSNNDIIFIANTEITSQVINIYTVEKDENDVVARKPLDKNLELYSLLEGMEYGDRERNYNKYLEKKNKTTKGIRHKTRKIFNKLFRKEYVHEKQY